MKTFKVEMVLTVPRWLIDIFNPLGVSVAANFFHIFM